MLGLKVRSANTTCQVTAVLHLYCLQTLYLLSGMSDSFTTLDKEQVNNESDYFRPFINKLHVV